MKQTFIKGFVFGTGFCCALLLFGLVVKLYLGSAVPTDAIELNNARVEWRQLSDSEKLDRATEMLVVRYKDGADQVKLAFIDKIYCKNPGCDSSFSEGASLPDQDFYPRSGVSVQEAVILLLQGPSQQPMSTWYVYENSVPALGGMPLDVLVKKFRFGS